MMKTTPFNLNIFHSFLEELTNSHLSSEDKSVLVAKMLSMCSFQEQENFALILKKKGFIFNLYQNPTPVTAAIIPVSTNEGIRLLSIVRNIEPQKGKIGLPGGYVDKLETFEHAAQRETLEETGLNLKAEEFSLMMSRTTPTNNTLVFCVYNRIVSSTEIDLNFSNEETQKIVLAEPTVEYCFPTHTEAAKRFWDNLHQYL